MRLERALSSVFAPPQQTRYGTVTAVNSQVCTVQLATGEIPVIYMKGAAPSVGDRVVVQRQGVVSYLLGVPSGALWVGGSGNGGELWRIPTSGQNPILYRGWYNAFILAVVEGPDTLIYAYDGAAAGLWGCISSGPDIGTFLGYVPLPGSAGANICVGPDKNLWVSDNNGGVWKVIPDPSVPFYDQSATFYPLGNGSPSFLAKGPDGNIWVSDEGSGGVWRVSTSGVGTFIGLPGSTPEGITAGPDGALWIADANGWAWRVTVSGSFTQMPPFSAEKDGLDGICVGPDGRLWFAASFIYPPTSPLTGTIFAMTLAGVSTQYPLPTAPGVGSAPYAIVTGSDGRLWFTDGDGYVWATTTQGEMTPYQLPNSAPIGICTGP